MLGKREMKEVKENNGKGIKSAILMTSKKGTSHIYANTLKGLVISFWGDNADMTSAFLKVITNGIRAA
jgi:hypothetical protein